MARQKFAASLFGYAILFYLWALLPSNFYEPTRTFHLPVPLWLTHLFILYIHEAGHFFFRMFGEDLYILGGTIMQVLVPFVWFLVARREESALAPVAVFFTGFSMVDASIYIRDAETRLLPLLGHHSKHDWATFLGRHDMLDWGVPLGDVFFFGGLIASLGAIVWGVTLSYRLYQQARLEASLVGPSEPPVD
ncbi:MAG TPA: hypothetical protein VMM58_11830 [Bacteroidota bacterium]|nr:hypothetical protein [Bacteroidota bacterium]